MLDLRLPPASISAAPAAGQLLLHSCSCLRRVAQLPGNCAAAAGGAKLSRVSAASRSMLTADLGIVIVVVVVILRPRSLVTSLFIFFYVTVCCGCVLRNNEGRYNLKLRLLGEF